jgi:hypothetical protein
MKHLKKFNEHNNIEIQQSGGLKCDNPDCDWTDMSIKVEDYPAWVDKPCPECGSNLLTQEDYDKTQVLMNAFDMINSIDPEELEKLTKNISEDEIIDAYLKLKEIGIKQTTPGTNEFHVDFGKNEK